MDRVETVEETPVVEGAGRSVWCIGRVDIGIIGVEGFVDAGGNGEERVGWVYACPENRFTIHQYKIHLLKAREY